MPKPTEMGLATFFVVNARLNPSPNHPEVPEYMNRRSIDLAADNRNRFWAKQGAAESY
jgi:hypothetical protein